MKSIKSKILCIVILAIVAVSASIGTVSYHLTHEIMHKNADQILSSVTLEKANDVNQSLKDMENAVNLVNIYATTLLSDINQLKDPAFLEHYQQEIESLFTAVAEDTKGAVGYYFHFAPELLSSEFGFFYDKETLDKPFKSQEVTDLSLYDPSERGHVGWYYEPVQAGKAIWMDPYVNLNNGIHMISYVIPVYCEDTLVGIAGMDLAFDFLLTAVNDVSLYDRGFAYLTTDKGSLVYTSHDLEEYSEEKIGPYAEASSSLDNGMQLTIRAAYRDIEKDSHVLLVNIVIIDVVLATCFIVITIFFANHIINPLKKLTKMARALADGENITELASTSKDEVGILSRIFMETSEKLQSNMSYIKALAYRDSLTGIKNTAAYTEAIADLEKQMNCGQPSFGVLVVDINDLKIVNDTYGHDAGNQLIIHTARLLSGTFRYSPLFRIGGDEFVVILTGQDLEKYRKRLKQLDDASRQETIPFDNCELRLSLARGVSIYNPEIDRTFNDVFNHADHAMYMHKQSMKQPKK